MRRGPRTSLGSAGRLLAVFALVLLVPVLGLGAALSSVYRAGVTQTALDDAEASARLLAQTSVQTSLAGQDLDQGLDVAGTADLGASVDAAVREGRLLGLRLHAPNGSVVFPPQDVAAPLSEPEQDAVALSAAGEANAILTTATPPSWVGGPAVQAVLVHAPVVAPSDGRVLGTVEVVLPYDDVARSAQLRTRSFVAVLLLGLVALYAVVATLAVLVTQRLRRQLAETDHLAHHDPLTGLPNRTLFRLRAEAAAARADVPTVVAILDLDRFKEVNDTLGHDAGDVLLRTVAERLHDAVRTDDTVARLGGDEFGLVLTGVTLASAAPTLHRVLDSLRAPLTIRDHQLTVSGSLGVACSPEHGTDVDDLLRRADMAMYVAKRSGRDMATCDGEDETAALDHLLMQGELDEALTGSQLVLDYQPLHDLRTGRTHAVEALVRWQHPRRGLLMPGDFLPLAEATGQVDALTTWVLQHALREVACWDDELRVAVNVPPSSLRDPRFLDRVLDALAVAGVSPGRLTLEMTESQVVRDVDAVRRTLTGLRRAGVGLSLDDFGQGNTSLAVLVDLPFTELKVDRSFVASLPDGPLQRTLVASLVAIAHAAGMQVVAEGIETAHVLELVRELGCDVAQGYHLGRPAPLTRSVVPRPRPVPGPALVSPVGGST